ncbi:MAG: right-handed parallel beta-helix repeat-containing protein, partial [Planctomycetes bacterium]|nr:right-handed parallel beta-helix repeat-containing protein [Planctomycetota bacterium]
NRAETDGPFATLERARDEIRRLKETTGLPDGATIFIRGGAYFLKDTLVLGPEDSGTENGRITYAAYPAETPILSGGRAVSGWRKPKEGNVWTAEIAEVKSGEWYFHQLFVNRARRVRARIPNEGYLVNDGPIEPLVDRTKARSDKEAKMGFRFKPGDMMRWRNLEDANVLHFHSWTASLRWIKELDEQNHIVRFTAPSGWPTGYWTKHERYYVENVPEALDAPGEWYLDRATGVLSYRPQANEDMAKAEVVAPRLRHLVRLDGDPLAGKFVTHITFKGLSFQHADWFAKDKGIADGQAAVFLDAAVMGRGARHCVIERCEIAHVGEYALWLGAGSKDNRVFHCHIRDLGGGGVKLGETTSPKGEADAAERNVVDNCFIHDTGHIFHAGVGVWIGRSSHNRVTHNEICDLDYTGVSVGWCWGYAPSSANHNLVEFNHIHHIGRGVLGDMGGIYTLGISPGTVLRHNVIHDVYSPGIGGGTGIYPDEGSSDLVIENNLVYNTEYGCFSQHYGRENIVCNNIFALSLTGEVARYRQEDHLSFIFERNIVLSTDGEFLHGGWSNGKYKIDHNLYWDTSTAQPMFDGLDFEDWQALGRDQNSVIADPLFVAPEKFDFRLKSGSPAARIGFQPFDVSQVGLYGEREWVNLPKSIVRKPIPLPQHPRRTYLKALDEGFEDTAVGERAAWAVTSGEDEAKGSSIRVTDELAASGKRCLKFTDAPELPRDWQPHLYYSPRYNRGVAHLSYDVRLEPGAVLIQEWRDASQPYLVGPSIAIDKAGQLTANGKPLMAVPTGQWLHFDFTAGLGPQATGTYTLTLSIPGQPPKTFENLPVGSPNWQKLWWLGFISLATE